MKTTSRVNISIDKDALRKYKLAKEQEKKEKVTRHFYDLLATLAKESSYTFNSIIFRQKEQGKNIERDLSKDINKENKPVVLFERKIKQNKSMNNLKNQMPPIRSRNPGLMASNINKTALRTMSVNLNVNVNLNYTQNGSTFNINNYTKRVPLNYVSLMETRHKNYKLALPVTNRSTLLDRKIISLTKTKLNNYK
jgi:hypothetical protein